MKNNLLSSLKIFIKENGKESLDNAVSTGSFIYSNTDSKYMRECEVLMICLTLSYHKKLNEAGQSERFSVKNDIAQQLNSNEKLDINLCSRTLDILEAALFDIEMPVEANIQPSALPQENLNETPAESDNEKQLKNTCKSCGRELQEGWKFCPFCEPSVSQTQGGGETPKPRYYLSYNFKESGPYELAAIETMAANKQITTDYWIRSENSSKWEPITTLCSFPSRKSRSSSSRQTKPSSLPSNETKTIPATDELNKSLEAKLKKTKRGLIAAIILGIIGIAIMGSVMSNSLQSDYETLQNNNKILQSNYETLQSNNIILQSNYETLQSNFENLQSNFETLQRNNNSLQRNYDTLQRDFERVKTKFKLIVTGITVGNSPDGTTWLNNPGSRLQASQIRYLTPVITYDSIVSEQLTFNVKIINPNGTLNTGSSSTGGFSYSSTLWVNNGDNQSLRLSGWGNNSRSTYSAGEYTIEVWYNNALLRSSKVTIYP